MKIWHAYYTLTPRLGSLGGHAKSRAREGALIRVEHDDGSIGYADVHPWSELGDEPLAIQIQKLANFETTELTQRSLELAALDSEARKAGVSAFQGLQVPNSHFLITDLKKNFQSELMKAFDEGYSTLKLKVGRTVLSLNEDRVTLEKSISTLQNFRLRLDFNSQRNHIEVQEWLQSLTPALRQSIEFLEDPCPWNIGNWAQLRENGHVPLAIDHESEEIFSTAESGPVAQLLADAIVKPAVQDPNEVVNTALRYVVTSYLDHPVGQLGAALEAGYLASRVQVGVCGLLSHTSYEKNSYSEAFPSKGPTLTPRLGDPGIGFTDLLEKENWQELYS
jgi:O-succinylbenzoate synthase